MFKVKFETRDYKYFLKLGNNEVCLSSDTPEDDDIKNIVERALEAYHKYQGEVFQQYLDQCYISGIVNAKDEISNNTEFQIDKMNRC